MKKYLVRILGLLLPAAMGLSACGSDRKAEETADRLLADRLTVQSYTVDATLVIDGKSNQFLMDYDETTGDMRLRQQTSGSEAVHLIRLNKKDYVSADGGSHYQPIEHQNVGVLDYNDLCGVLVPKGFTSSNQDDTLVYSGYEKQIFESVKSAFGLNFSGFEERAYRFEIKITPDESGRFIQTCIVHIVAEQGDRRSEIDLSARFSNYNNLEPIVLPPDTPQHPAAEKPAGENGETAVPSEAAEQQTAETSGAEAP